MSEFPQMIFHIVENPRTVDTKEELDEYLAKGWSMTSVEFDKVKMVESKIAYHQAEIERLTDLLGELNTEPKKAHAKRLYK